MQCLRTADNDGKRREAGNSAPVVHPGGYCATPGAAPAAPEVKKPAAAAGPEAVPVMEILVFGLVLFGVTVLLLVGVSVLSHL